MSLLTVIGSACALVGLRRPTTAANAPDATSTAQMVEMARQEAKSLANRHDWSGIVFPWQFTSTANQSQYGALPDDFARFTFAGGIYGPWGRINGPTANRDWSRLTSFPQVQSALNGSYRVFGGGLQIYPAPASGQSYRFDYVSKQIYTAADGTPKDTWTIDTDVCAIPEDLIVLGVIWRWLQFKGLDYGEALRNAELEFAKLAGNDGGGRNIISVGNARLSADEYAYPGILGPRP